MYRLNVLLFNLLDWHKVHRRPAGCLDDCLRIVSVVLVCLYEGFDELGTDWPNRCTDQAVILAGIRGTNSCKTWHGFPYFC